MINLLNKLQVTYILLLTLLALISLHFYKLNKISAPIIMSNIDALDTIENVEYKENIQKPSKSHELKTSPTVKELLNYYNEKKTTNGSAHSKICPNSGQNIKIMFVVTSKPDNEATRNNVRRTWGTFSLRENLAIAFFTGLSNNEKIVNKLKNEQQIYGDLIRGKFLDTYDNLTLKTTFMLQWVTKYCSKAEYVFKVDDDIFVNIDLLLEFIDNKIITSKRAIYGHLVTGWHPVRDPEDKYFISKHQYEPDSFPQFTTGGAYIFPSRLATELYNEALNLPYIKLEDVFYNGIVASRLNISRINIEEFINNWVDFEDCIIKSSITIHGAEGELLYYIWYRVNAITYAECGF